MKYWFEVFSELTVATICPLMSKQINTLDSSL